MKKKIAVISMSLIVGGLLYFTGIKNSKAYYYGPLPGYSGSPRDGQTCDVGGCHNSHPLQSAQPWIASNVPVGGYSPDTVYTITAKAVKTGLTSFGFEISPQTTSGSPLGTMIITNSTRTQISTIGSRQYMEQTQNSYQGTDSVVWTFQWKAPASGTGTVTFYGAFNCGNGNSSAAGSFVYPATLIIPENLTAGTNNLSTASTPFTTFPNPAHTQINISYTLKEAQTVEINLYGMNGGKISTLLNTMENTGTYTQGLLFPSEITSGIYFIQLITNGQSAVQKIIVE